MRCLVTGGAGFIGSHLVDELMKRKHYVRVLDNLSTGKKENLLHHFKKKNFHFIKGDVTNIKTCQRALLGIDVVFHYAAKVSVAESIIKPNLYFKVNVGGTLNILKCLKNSKRQKLINISSCAVYGNAKKLPILETHPVQPLSPYAESKLVQESLCKNFSKNFGLDTISLRYFNVYGPRQSPKSTYAAAIPIFFDQIKKDKRPVIFGDGKQTRDFVFVKDVVMANIKAMQKKDGKGEIINIGGGHRININKIISLILKANKSDLKPIYKSKRKGEVKHSLASIKKSRNKLRWVPATTIEKGIKIIFDHS